MPLSAECPVCLEDFRFPEDGVFFLTCGELGLFCATLSTWLTDDRVGHGVCARCSQLQQWTRCPTCRSFTFASIHPPQRIFVQIAGSLDVEEPIYALRESRVAGAGTIASTSTIGEQQASDSSGADAEEAFETLESLADVAHLDSTTKVSSSTPTRTNTLLILPCSQPSSASRASLTAICAPVSAPSASNTPSSGRAGRLYSPASTNIRTGCRRSRVGRPG